MAKRAHDSKERVNRKKHRRVVEGEDECKVEHVNKIFKVIIITCKCHFKLPVTLKVRTDKHSNPLFRPRLLEYKTLLSYSLIQDMIMSHLHGPKPCRTYKSTI